MLYFYPVYETINSSVRGGEIYSVDKSLTRGECSVNTSVWPLLFKVDLQKPAVISLGSPGLSSSAKHFSVCVKSFFEIFHCILPKTSLAAVTINLQLVALLAQWNSRILPEIPELFSGDRWRSSIDDGIHQLIGPRVQNLVQAGSVKHLYSPLGSTEDTLLALRSACQYCRPTFAWEAA